MTKKVIIIGAGLAGLQTAFFLHREGIEVTIIERREGAALETSFANGGLITPSHAAPWNSPGILRVLLAAIGNPSASLYIKPAAIPHYMRWGMSFVRNSTPARFKQTIARNARLGLYSIDQYQELVDELGLTFDGGHGGTMMVYRNPASLARAGAANDMVRHGGIEVQKCSPSELATLEPALSPIESELAGGYYYPSDQHGDAHQYCAALVQYLSHCGVLIHYNETVTDIELSGDKITKVITDKQRHEADAVVLAAGFWSAKLGRKLGLRLPIKPVKGYSVTYDVSNWRTAPKMPVVDDELHIAMTPLGDRIRFVGTAEFGGYDPHINPTRIENLHRAACAVYPEVCDFVEGGAPVSTWCNHRPMTPDCLPILGQQGPQNLFLNTGHGYLGWTTACGTSRAISDLIVGRASDLDLDDYRPDRF